MFDDARASVYDNAYPVMDARGIKTTIYAISDLIGTDTAVYMDATELGEMYADGHDIGNHSKTHVNLGEITQAQAEAELTGCANALEALGFTRASKHVAYPFGGNGGSTHAAMTATGMLTGRTTIDGNVSLDEVHTIGLQYLRIKYIKNTVSLADAKNIVYYALYGNEKIALLFHSIVETPSDTYEWSTANFTALMDYIQGYSIPMLTISEWYTQYRAAYP